MKRPRYFKVSYADEIRSAAQHLLAFIGPENPEPFIVRDDDTEQPAVVAGSGSGGEPQPSETPAAADLIKGKRK